MTKIQGFLELNDLEFSEIFQNFTTKNLNSMITMHQRDAYFILANANQNIRSLSRDVGEEYVASSIVKMNAHKEQVLYIVIACAVIITVATLTLLPVAFKLDADQEKVVKKWLAIGDQTKQDCIDRINHFMADVNLENISEKALLEKAEGISKSV